MSINDDADLLLRRAWKEIEFKESLVARTPLEGPIAIESNNTHMGTFHDAPFEIKQPMDHMNILLENGMDVINNPEYKDDTKVHVLKGIFEQLIVDHQAIFTALSTKKEA